VFVWDVCILVCYDAFWNVLIIITVIIILWWWWWWKMITLCSLFRLQLSFSFYSLYMRSAGKKFPNCGSITVLGLSEINAGIVAFGVYTLPSSFFPTAGNTSGFPISWCCPALSAVRLQCPRYPLTSSLYLGFYRLPSLRDPLNFTSLNGVLSLEKGRSYRGVFRLLWPDLTEPRMLILFLVAFQQMRQRFVAIHLVFKPTVKMS